MIASRPPEPGADWDALPLPALILDAEGRVLAINDAAEMWLNMSRRSTTGRRTEGPAVSRRLRVQPPLGELARILGSGGEGAALSVPAHFEIADRSGGHIQREAVVYAAPAAQPAQGVSIVIVPGLPGAAAGASRKAALSAVGMAQMLAHEIKNPLAGIRGAAQLIEMQADPGGAEGEDAEEGGIADLTGLIVAECQRVVELLRQVERFGDTSPPALAPVNLHDLLERARRTAALGAASGVTISAEYDPSLPEALADADQLVQVVLNLIANAAEAIARAGQGTTVRLRTHYDGAVRQDGRALPLQIEIEDDGPGLPEDLADRIFEPFVSGRENGTGLGLALAAKIMEDHGGRITTDSRPGRTVFRLSLPLAGRG